MFLGKFHPQNHIMIILISYMLHYFYMHFCMYYTLLIKPKKLYHV